MKDLVVNVWKKLGSGVDKAWEWLKWFCRKVWDWNCKCYRSLKDLSISVWRKIQWLDEKVWGVVCVPFRALKNVLSSAWNKGKQVVANWRKNVWDLVCRVFRSLKDLSISVWRKIQWIDEKVWGVVCVPFRALKNVIKNLSRGLWSNVKLGVTKVWNWVQWMDERVWTLLVYEPARFVWTNCVVILAKKFGSLLGKFGNLCSKGWDKVCDLLTFLGTNFKKLFWDNLLLVIWRKVFLPPLRFVWNIILKIKKTLNKFNWKRGIKSSCYVLDVRPGDRKRLKSPDRDGIQNYYVMKNESFYSIYLRNDGPVLCDCRLSIDGKDMGTFRIFPKKAYSIQKPAPGNTRATGRFTFVTEEKVLSMSPSEFKKTGIIPGEGQNGIVEAVFVPAQSYYTAAPQSGRRLSARNKGKQIASSAKRLRRRPTVEELEEMEILEDEEEEEEEEEGGSGFVAGATTLRGKSNQKQMMAGNVTLDESKAVAIHARLVGLPKLIK